MNDTNRDSLHDGTVAKLPNTPVSMTSHSGVCMLSHNNYVTLTKVKSDMMFIGSLATNSFLSAVSVR